MEEKKNRKNIFTSLPARVAMIIILACLVIAGTTTYIASGNFETIMDEMYTGITSNIASSVASNLDGDLIEEYANGRERDEQYELMLESIREIQNNSGATYVYVEKLNSDRQSVTFIMDADIENPYDFMEQAPLSDNMDVDRFEEGIGPIILNDETTNYKKVYTVFKPVRNSEGKSVACVGVDMSFDRLAAYKSAFYGNLRSALIPIILAMAVLFTGLMIHSVVKPIRKLSLAAKTFVSDGAIESASKMPAVTEKDMGSSYELKELYGSICQMENDIHDYIENLKTVTAEKERFSAELDVATRIQTAALPSIFPAFPERSDMDIFATMRPAKEVGGDFYDFFFVDENKIAMVIADVSGKGVPAALFMMVSKILIKTHCQNTQSPAEALKIVNKLLCETNEAGMFVTVWLAVVDLETGKLTATNAGHERPAIRRKDGKYELIKDKHGFIVAGMDGVKYPEYELELNPGDRLFLYTDGVPEATDAQNNLFGTDNMIEALNTESDADLETMAKNVKTAIDEFVKDVPQFDDITMLCFEYKGK